MNYGYFEFVESVYVALRGAGGELRGSLMTPVVARGDLYH